MITQQDIEWFTKGSCAILAEAIHRATAWERVAFITEWGHLSYHAFIRIPDGRYLDVHGVQTEQDILTRWGQKKIAPVNPVANVQPWGWPWPEQYPGSRARAEQITPELVKLAHDAMNS